MVSYKIPIVILISFIGILFFCNIINNNGNEQLQELQQQHNHENSNKFKFDFSNNNNKLLKTSIAPQQQQQQQQQQSKTTTIVKPTTTSSKIINAEDKINIPLKLLNIFPSANIGQDGKAEKLILKENDPITILFNRPVISLGVLSNYYPFTLKCIGGLSPRGNYRWVTTSIARFDILNGNWPTNLDCTFSVNSNIECYDGTKLSSDTTSSTTSTSISFTTPPPTIEINDIISEKTSNFTNYHWNYRYQIINSNDEYDQYFEIPPDAKIKFSISDQFDSSSIARSLVAFKQNSSPLKRTLIPYKIISCPNVTRSIPLFYYRNNNNIQFNYLCIEFDQVKGKLDVGGLYTFEFKKGTKINDKSGLLKESILINFSGLRQFKFDFTSKELSNVIQKLAIGHGLSKGITSSMLISTFSIITRDGDIGDTSVTTTTKQPQKSLQITSKLLNDESALLIHIIGLEPSKNYTINIGSNENIRDCWGLPLIGNSWDFTMAKVSSFDFSYDLTDFQLITTSNNGGQEEDQDDTSNGIEDQDGGGGEDLFYENNKNHYNDYVTIHQNSKRVNLNSECKAMGDKVLLGYPITKSNVEQAMLSYLNGKNLMKQKPKKSVVLNEPSDTTFYNHSLDSKSLWKSSGVYLEVYQTDLDYSCDPIYRIKFISSIDIGISFIVSSSNSLGCWLTRLSDGSNVKDAQVSFYQIVNSREVQNQRDIVLVGGSSKKTSNMGTVEFKTNNTNGFVVVEYDGGKKLYVAKTDVNSLYNYYYPQQPKTTTAVIVTDRGLYNAGEQIHCKVYMNGDFRKYRFTLRITWIILNSVQEFSEIIDVDDDYGTANITIDIPDQVSNAPYNILVQGQDTNSDSSPDIYFYGDFVISDPRIPSGILKVSSNKRFIQFIEPTSNNNQYSTTFSIQTSTYLGTPLPNKNVTINCKFDGNDLFGRILNFASSQSITTDDKGLAILKFNIDSKSSSEFQDGDILTCSASYLDPTGSMIKDKPISIPILSSEYRVEIQSNDYSTFFGYPSTASAILINQTSLESIKNVTVEMKLIYTNSSITQLPLAPNQHDYSIYKVVKNSIYNIWQQEIEPPFIPTNIVNNNNSAIPIPTETILQPNTATTTTNKSILKNNGITCRFKTTTTSQTDSFNEDTRKCFVVLPSINVGDENYYLMATVYLPNGKTIVKYQKYNINKKSIFSPPTQVLSLVKKSEYYTGQYIVSRYYNPFKSATFTLRYGCGNLNTWKQIQVKSHGFQTFSIKVPAGCESKKLGVNGVLIGNKYGFKLSDSTKTSLTTYDVTRPDPQTFSRSFKIKDKPIADLSIKLSNLDSIYHPGENASFSIHINDPITKKPINQPIEACIMVIDKRNLDLYNHPMENGDRLLFNNLYTSVTDSRFNLIHNYREMLKVIGKILNFDKWGYFFWGRNSPITKNFSDHFQNDYQWFTETNYGTGGGGTSGIPFFSARSESTTTMEDSLSSSPPKEKSMPIGNNKNNNNNDDKSFIHTNFKTTPLFIGKTIISNGIGNFDFKLPDDLTTFTIRVYAVTKDTHKLISSESNIISRKDINMISFSPRFVRTGDKFEVGVSITRIDESIDTSSLRVRAKVKDSCIEFNSKLDGQDIKFTDGSSKIQVSLVFPMIAKYQCSAVVFFFLEDKISGKILNGITSEFSVLGKQSPLYVGSNFEVKANSTSAELLTLPQSEGDIGNLKLTVGVGNYPLVQEKCLKLLSISKKRLPSSVDLLSQQVTYGALSSYSYNSSLIVLSQQTIESVNEGFYVYSRSVISWYPKGEPELYPNVYAIVLHSLMDVTDTAGWSILANISNWVNFVDQQLNADIQNSVRSKTAVNKELIGLASIGLGYYWAPKDEDLNELYSFDALTANITDNCSLLCQTYFSLAAIIRGESSYTFIDVVINNLKNSIHVQSKTAYISEVGQQQTNSKITELTTFASILFTLRNETSNPLLAKMISFIAIGSTASEIKPSPYLFYGSEISSQQEALSLIAISFYDKSLKNISPDLTFTAYQPSSTAPPPLNPPLLEYHFSPNNSADNIEKKFPYSALSSNKTILFSSVGKGQVSVAVGIEYTPINIPTTPIYNGFYVEKIIIDISSGGISSSNTINGNNNNKNNSLLFYRGQEVLVVLSVTIPDYMNDVFIEDPSSGGIEPIDNNIDHGDNLFNLPIFSNNQQRFSSNKLQTYQFSQIKNDRLIWFYQPFSHRETRRDKVIYQGSNISPSSYQVSYKCIVTSVGSFTMPPTKVYSSTQPELFGTSKGYTYTVK